MDAAARSGTVSHERWEMIDGVVYDMSPPPFEVHQRVAGNLHGEFYMYLKGRPCRVYSAPFGVWFREENEDEHVEPDIAIVCDPSKLRQKGCVGAPDLIAEVLSPSTAGKDRTVKLRKYTSFGVREYWIVDPVHQTVDVYRTEEGHAFSGPAIYTRDDAIHVGIFPDLTVRLADIFDT